MRLLFAVIGFIAAMSLSFGVSTAKSGTSGVHEGVASCAGSTCHGRQVASGLVVRQNELYAWQDPSTASGAHSRAWTVLKEPRAESIAQRLRLGPAENAPVCLGCHTDSAGLASPGQKFLKQDGVGCEACHGSSSGWLASHYAVGGDHEANVAAGMTRLDSPRVRAEVCLDCHFGSAKQNQFVSHRLMSAGHPRLSFELHLFSELQRHYDETHYSERGKISDAPIKVWAIGQALSLERSLTLYSDARHGQDGSFPEFYFYDCHSCHRQIGDEASARPRFTANPARPIAGGAPPFNDENMIVLTAAVRVAAPGLAQRFETDSLAFHTALASDRPSSVRAAAQLSRTAHALAAAFEARKFSRSETLAILDQVTDESLIARYTDYEGGVQAVMAIDALLDDLGPGVAASAKADIDRAYQAVREPNAYDQASFRDALGRLAVAIRRLR